MYQDLQIPSPLEQIEITPGKSIFLKREDLIHPMVSGNKFRKLKYNLQKASENDCTKIISFGGVFSNHIHALAFACQKMNIPLLLILRGENVSNPTIDFVRSRGAELKFISRSEYRLRNTPAFLKNLNSDYPNAYIIPEGGTNQLALKGIAEMLDELYLHSKLTPCEICVSYGSGGTSLGILKELKANDNLHIFPALKIPNLKVKIADDLCTWNIQKQNYQVHSEFHFGGYAKWDDQLIQYINNFKAKHRVQLDPIYTGKLMYGVEELIHNNHFDHNKKIIVIHTGGLQGITGFNMRYGNILI